MKTTHISRAKVESLKRGEYIKLTARQASYVARLFGCKRPRVGYEVCLKTDELTGQPALFNGESILWLASTGHSQFGWFGKDTETHPFEVRR
jgi:hypothetical protein